MKGVLLDWYLDEKIIFRMIKWDLASKKDSELWEFPIFDTSDSKSLTRYQKILWICSFGYKNLLNFAWHYPKFHNCHHSTAYWVRLCVAGRMVQALNFAGQLGHPSGFVAVTSGNRKCIQPISGSLLQVSLFDWVRCELDKRLQCTSLSACGGDFSFL